MEHMEYIHIIKIDPISSELDFLYIYILVGGFNPFEKYQSNWIISPGRGENKKYLKPPPSIYMPKDPEPSLE